MNKLAELLTVNELAAYLRVSTTTIYRLVHAKRLPMFRINRKDIRFNRAQIDKWCATQERGTSGR